MISLLLFFSFMKKTEIFGCFYDFMRMMKKSALVFSMVLMMRYE